MRYERLVIDGGRAGSFALDFHHRVTVIAGVGRVEREGLMAELVGVLGSSRAGGHIEIEDDRGRHLAVFRPHGARHRVVDIDAGVDVSASFRGDDGSIDLLAREGLDQLTAKRRLRVTASDLAQSSRSAAIVRRLAAVPQPSLWQAAERVRTAEATLQSLAEEAGTAPEDLEVVDGIERRHAAFEAAQERHERVRRLTFLVATVCTIAAVPAAMFIGTSAALLLIVPASLITAASLVMWRKMEGARAAEQEALEQAGANSYLGFHLQRVNSLLSSDQNRKRLMSAAEAHRGALATWAELAGDAQVSWALDHQEEILAAARLRASTGSLDPTDAADDLQAILAQELVVRLGEARRVAASGETMPLVLDDPFTGFDSSMKPALLELISDASKRQQIVLLTEDPDVAAWARLEALTGNLAVVEPSAAPGRAADDAAAADATVRSAHQRIVL
ncbi:MAG TPA: hypothetical protein VK866_00775 [Acidimicrobiales bacterium]|nr:hypothetical protein [Acidimicrobiales bacterium]